MRSLVIAAIAVALILSFGIIEFVDLSNDYADLNSDTLVLMYEAKNGSLNLKTVDEYTEKWICVREKAEILLPHVDVYECNLRISECRGFVAVGDLDNAYVQLTVIEELTRYIPHLMKPIWVHII